MSLLNNKKGGFTAAPLPQQTQWSPVFAFYTADFNNDGTNDILTAGNFYGVHPYEGRYDASYGNVFLNDRNKKFETAGNLQTGLLIEGEVRDIKNIKTKSGSMIAIARNNKTIQFYNLTKKKPWL